MNTLQSIIVLEMYEKIDNDKCLDIYIYFYGKNTFTCVCDYLNKKYINVYLNA